MNLNIVIKLDEEQLKVIAELIDDAIDKALKKAIKKAEKKL